MAQVNVVVRVVFAKKYFLQCILRHLAVSYHTSHHLPSYIDGPTVGVTAVPARVFRERNITALWGRCNLSRACPPTPGQDTDSDNQGVIHWHRPIFIGEGMHAVDIAGFLGLARTTHATYRCSYRALL